MIVPADDLRDNLNELLDLVSAGESIDLEVDGRIVASLRPPRVQAATSREQVLEVFRYVPPINSRRFFDDLYGEAGLDDTHGGRFAENDT